jgi:hypothetical protein
MFCDQEGNFNCLSKYAINVCEYGRSIALDISLGAVADEKSRDIIRGHEESCRFDSLHSSHPRVLLSVFT